MATNVVRFPTPAPQQKPKKTKKAKGLMPDGRYRVMVELDPEPNGKRKRVPVYGTTYAKALEEAVSMRKARRDGQNLEGAKQSVGAWAETWLKTYGGGAGYSTNYSTAMYIKQLVASDLGRMNLKDVRDVHVQMFANSISNKSKSAVTKIRSVVKRVFLKAVANRMLAFDPTAAIRWTHAGEGSHRALEDSEITAIVAHWRHHHTGLWAMLMLWAGLRRGEVLALEWADIDFDARVIRVSESAHFERNRAVRVATTKTVAGVRSVPILPPLYDALAGLYGPPRSPLVCTSAKGEAVTQASFKRGWDTLMHTLTRAVNGEARPFRPGQKRDPDKPYAVEIDFRPHDLRHTFCTMLYDAGVDLKTAQELMGHDDAAMTMEIYTHLSKERKRQSVTGLEKWCSKWCSNSAKQPQTPAN